MELLVDGKNAFPEIISCIRKAQKSIFINMFIWRDDTIGNMLAEEVLAAADRGVAVTLSKDRYATVLEISEESRRSFFHRTPAFGVRFNAFFLSRLYNRDRRAMPARIRKDEGALLQRFLDHPMIHADRDRDKADHSKFFVFDDSTLILGGINVEDKENGADFAGRPYRDYMVKITEPELVSEFFEKRRMPSPGGHFLMNCKETGRFFEMRQAYLDLIESAEESLTILMAYFAPIPAFEESLLRAASRGVKVTVVIPEKANFMDSQNKRAVSRLLRKSGGQICAYTFPGMLHAKLLMNEKSILLGSCNITGKAFRLLDELDLAVPNDESPFAETVRQSVRETLDRSTKRSSIRFHPLAAAIECRIS